MYQGSRHDTIICCLTGALARSWRGSRGLTPFQVLHEWEPCILRNVLTHWATLLIPIFLILFRISSGRTALSSIIQKLAALQRLIALTYIDFPIRLTGKKYCCILFLIFYFHTNNVHKMLLIIAIFTTVPLCSRIEKLSGWQFMTIQGPGSSIIETSLTTLDSWPEVHTLTM